MGLAASQSRYLFLTARKADVEHGLAINSNRKLALTREMSDLTTRYNSRLNTKQISFKNGGEYEKINYEYLMGYGARFTAITNNTRPIKGENSYKTVLTDYNGRVVISDEYAKYFAMAGITGADAQGRGGTFGEDEIAKIILIIAGGGTTTNIEGESAADKIKTIKNVHNGGEVDTSFEATVVNTLTGVNTGTTTVNNSSQSTSYLKSIIDFYWPIFQAAASNGWTTEYNIDIGHNDDYISDALVSGTFQLADVNDYGNYGTQDSLSYFVTAGVVASRNDSEVRAKITAWYDAEKSRINYKETQLDLEISDLSTTLEAIKTEMQSVKSIIDNETEKFNWGSNG